MQSRISHTSFFVKLVTKCRVDISYDLSFSGEEDMIDIQTTSPSTQNLPKQIEGLTLQ